MEPIFARQRQPPLHYWPRNRSAGHGTVDTIVDLIGRKGQRQYGPSAIDQRAHARLQAGEIAVFESQSHDAEAVQLRRFDEGAKVKRLQGPDVAHYVPPIRACLLKG